VLALVIVEGEPSADAGLRVGHRPIGMEIDLLVFQAAPQPRDEDVVHVATPRLRGGRLLPSMLIVIPQCSSAPVNALLVNWQPWSVLKISGLPYCCQRLLHSLDAKIGAERVRQPPRQQGAAHQSMITTR